MSKDHYKTQSLSLATAIQILSTTKLEKVEHIPNSRKVTFCFDSSQDPDFQTIINRFYARQLPIDAATYFDTLKSIKSLLYEELQ